MSYLGHSLEGEVLALSWDAASDDGYLKCTVLRFRLIVVVMISETSWRLLYDRDLKKAITSCGRGIAGQMWDGGRHDFP